MGLMSKQQWGDLRSRRTFVRRLAGTGLLVPSALLVNRLGGASPHGESGSKVLFTDISAQAGLAGAKNTSGARKDKQFLLEEMGGGVALFDYDNDGWLDIFLVNDATFENIPGEKRPTSYLFRNNRAGTF